VGGRKVAVESVRKFRPKAQLTAHFNNIKESQFGLDFFKRFAVVLNGLDNLEARKHVNRLCLAAEVPLVESGTQGYLGQVCTPPAELPRHKKSIRWTRKLHQKEASAEDFDAAMAQVTVHLKDHSECFECQPKALPKSFPVCTLRNHPDRPIHCVVWAKDMLFPRLFGKEEEVTDLDENQGTYTDAFDANSGWERRPHPAISPSPPNPSNTSVARTESFTYTDCLERGFGFGCRRGRGVVFRAQGGRGIQGVLMLQVGLARGFQKMALERWTQIPNVRFALGTGYNRGRWLGLASRNGRVSSSPTRKQLFHRCTPCAACPFRRRVPCTPLLSAARLSM
jgi:hypothetical protein